MRDPLTGTCYGRRSWKLSDFKMTKIANARWKGGGINTLPAVVAESTLCLTLVTPSLSPSPCLVAFDKPLLAFLGPRVWRQKKTRARSQQSTRTRVKCQYRHHHAACVRYSSLHCALGTPPAPSARAASRCPCCNRHLFSTVFSREALQG